MGKTLEGGRVGQIRRQGDRVYRPAGPWSRAVHDLLTHLRAHAFYVVPEPLGFDERGNEVLSYVPGEVYNYPLTGAVASRQALCSAAQLLRRYHDLTVALVENPPWDNDPWQLPPREPRQVICHGDYAPYNVALAGNQAVGIIDFDTAHPGPRIWDIAYAVYCWAPFKTNPDDALGNLAEQSTRAKWFCDSYGLDHPARQQLVDTMICRIQALVDFMRREAAQGNATFIANMQAGHHVAYLADIDYLERNRQVITASLG